MCAVASHYSIIQVGVTTFTAKGPEGEGAAATEYEAKPFNFYVFPPPNMRRDIVLSASSTHFLKGNNMDFQQWISKGVPFVDREKEVSLSFKTWLRRWWAAAALPDRPPPCAAAVRRALGIGALFWAVRDTCAQRCTRENVHFLQGPVTEPHGSCPGQVWSLATSPGRLLGSTGHSTELL